jgi:hypothetical protein
LLHGAVVERLAGFQSALELAHIQAATKAGIHHADRNGGGLIVDGVELDLPGGQPLIADVSLSLGRGESALLSGPSGAGKSTLLRAITGIWPFGRGEICVPSNTRVLFLPQNPCLPIGTLRETVSYPMPAGGVDYTNLREALEAVGLPELANRLDERPATGHFNSLPVSSSALPLPALTCRSPIGCSSTKRPRRWTKQRKRASTVWYVIGSRGRLCSAWVTGRRFAPFTTGNYSRSPTAMGLLP